MQQSFGFGTWVKDAVAARACAFITRQNIGLGDVTMIALLCRPLILSQDKQKDSQSIQIINMTSSQTKTFGCN